MAAFGTEPLAGNRANRAGVYTQRTLGNRAGNVSLRAEPCCSLRYCPCPCVVFMQIQLAHLLKRHFGEAAELTGMEALAPLHSQLLDRFEPDLKVLIDALTIEFTGHASEFDLAVKRLV